MRRVAESKPSVHVISALERLEALDFEVALLADVHYSERVVSEVGPEAVSAVLYIVAERCGCATAYSWAAQCLPTA